jgi:2-polyprenyl-3-methyl-5-hydroxy-6-metoxy-1,4-benzoquinol methylase
VVDGLAAVGAHIPPGHPHDLSKWETPKRYVSELSIMICPACGTAHMTLPLKGVHEQPYKDDVLRYQIYGCMDCGTQFCDPMKAAPPDWYADIGEYYGWRWEFDRFLEDIDKLGRDHGPVRVLEIGCGEGIVMERLRSITGEVWGLEFNRTAAQTCSAKGLRVIEGTIEEFFSRYSGESFDAVAFFQVLEHLEDPLAFLRMARHLLHQTGRIYLSVPNPDRYQLNIYRESWDYPPHHLSRFTKAGIQRLLDRAGFAILKIVPRPIDRESRRTAVRSLYKRLSFPNFLKAIIKFPLRIALYPAGWYYWATSEGQDLYLMAQPK